MSSRRSRPDQELEIYNFRVVPDLQTSKKVDVLMIHMFLFVFNVLDFRIWIPQVGFGVMDVESRSWTS